MKNKHLCMSCGGKHTKYYSAGIRKAKFKDILGSASRVWANGLYNLTDKILFDALKDDPKFLKNGTSSLVFTGNKDLRSAEDKATNTVNTITDITGNLINQVGVGMLTGQFGKKPDTANDINTNNPPITPNPTNTSNTTNQTGGTIPVQGGVLKKLSSTGIQANGNTHDEGGIMLDKDTEIEDKEGVHNIEDETVISSNVLENKETNNTFAKDMTKLEKDKGHYEKLLEEEYKKTKDKENYNTILYKKRISQIDSELEELFNKQETLAQNMGLRDEQGMPNEASQEIVGNEEAIQQLQDNVEQAMYGGIHIKEENKGKFTNKANDRGLGVQEFANKVLNNKYAYDATTVKQANFAKNATKFKHKTGGLTRKDYLGYKEGSPYNLLESLVINSNNITMKDVNKSILGVSDEGDIKYMRPNKEYKFKGSKVLEIPIQAQTGGIGLNKYQLDKLNNKELDLLLETIPKFKANIKLTTLQNKQPQSKVHFDTNIGSYHINTTNKESTIENKEEENKKFKLSNEQKLILGSIGTSYLQNVAKQNELKQYIKEHGYTNPYKLESMYTDRRNYYKNIEPLVTNRDIQNNITTSVNSAIQQGNPTNPSLNNLIAKGMKLYNDTIINSRANSDKNIDDATDKLANYSSQRMIADNMLNMQRNKQKGELIENDINLANNVIKSAVEQGILKPNDDAAFAEYLKKFLVLQNSKSGRDAIDAKSNLKKYGGYIGKDKK